MNHCSLFQAAQSERCVLLWRHYILLSPTSSILFRLPFAILNHFAMQWENSKARLEPLGPYQFIACQHLVLQRLSSSGNVGNAPHENLRSTDVNLPKPQERQHVSWATWGPRVRRALASCTATIHAMLRIN